MQSGGPLPFDVSRPASKEASKRSVHWHHSQGRSPVQRFLAHQFRFVAGRPPGVGPTGTTKTSGAQTAPSGIIYAYDGVVITRRDEARDESRPTLIHSVLDL